MVFDAIWEVVGKGTGFVRDAAVKYIPLDPAWSLLIVAAVLALILKGRKAPLIGLWMIMLTAIFYLLLRFV